MVPLKQPEVLRVQLINTLLARNKTKSKRAKRSLYIEAVNCFWVLRIEFSWSIEKFLDGSATE